VNLVANGGFETGDLSGWTLDTGQGGFGVTGDAADVYGGSYSAFGNGPGGVISRVLPTVIGAKYNIAFQDKYKYSGS